MISTNKIVANAMARKVAANAKFKPGDWVRMKSEPANYRHKVTSVSSDGTYTLDSNIQESEGNLEMFKMATKFKVGDVLGWKGQGRHKACGKVVKIDTSNPLFGPKYIVSPVANPPKGYSSVEREGLYAKEMAMTKVSANSKVCNAHRYKVGDKVQSVKYKTPLTIVRLGQDIHGSNYRVATEDGYWSDDIMYDRDIEPRNSAACNDAFKVGDYVIGPFDSKPRQITRKDGYDFYWKSSGGEEMKFTQVTKLKKCDSNGNIVNSVSTNAVVRRAINSRTACNQGDLGKSVAFCVSTLAKYARRLDDLQGRKAQDEEIDKVRKDFQVSVERCKIIFRDVKSASFLSVWRSALPNLDEVARNFPYSGDSYKAVRACEKLEDEEYTITNSSSCNARYQVGTKVQSPSGKIGTITSVSPGTDFATVQLDVPPYGEDEWDIGKCRVVRNSASTNAELYRYTDVSGAVWKAAKTVGKDLVTGLSDHGDVEMITVVKGIDGWGTFSAQEEAKVVSAIGSALSKFGMKVARHGKDSGGGIWIETDKGRFTNSENALNDNNALACNDARHRRKLQKEINDLLRNVTKGMFHDQQWLAVRMVADTLRRYGYDVETNGGKYQESGHNKAKIYTIRAEKDGEVFDGSIYCMGAGTVDDPFSKYDISVMW